MEVLIREEGQAEETVAVLTESPTRGRIALPGDRERIVRLGLRAALPDSGPGSHGIVLTRPMVKKASAGEEPPNGEAAAPSLGGHQDPGRRPNVIVYLIDTLRSDHLGCYGYRKNTSPEIDAFARDGILFENAIAQSSWTKPSVASLFTGLAPLSRGVHKRRRVLSAGGLTLQEILQENGYRTAAFMGNRLLTEESGFSQGFDDFHDLRHADGETMNRGSSSTCV